MTVLGNGFGDVLFLGVSLGGGFVGMLIFGYLFARHNSARGS
ncbi:predicted TIM-barrel fold metal-dependent hydrolase (plasmid) [Halogeometricum borinquense DSM 11551]|uniref:Predicted TIM-barrel fold metal-dependent hydrolase n=1 Tax=Halogeometricum borinquense (strain ATCC 700274 / DSM 11551 / JCM 10706 / KCTC 4070 / PR3) TaxID=469382 RepID=E4NVR6_HALBP|nr:predicted TIM-barrel fold metal-dependent hydrolase [Halogeometricum borinquense DSM 11551]